MACQKVISKIISRMSEVVSTKSLREYQRQSGFYVVFLDPLQTKIVVDFDIFTV